MTPYEIFWVSISPPTDDPPSMTEPTTLRAGDSATWTRELPQYPAPAGWSLHYRLLWPSGAPVEIPTTPDAGGTVYTATLTAVATAAFPATPATLVWWVQSTAGERHTLGRQAVAVLADLTTATQHDPRTANEKALADARAALARYVGGGQSHVAEYSIAGRTMKFRTADELKSLVQHFEAEVARDNAIAAAFQGASSGRFRIRM